MIITTLISFKLIDYGTIVIKNNLSIFNKIIKYAAQISYEIYLFQYPLIFLFQYINIDSFLKIPIIIILTIILSYILNFSINFNKDKKLNIPKYIMSIIISCVSLYGIYQYVLAQDHTLEMKTLEEQLVQNEKEILEKQKEYESKLQQEENDWNLILENLENGESELNDVVSNLQIVGIGDSVMLGATPNLYKEFPNSYFDAEISRSAWVVNTIVQNLKNKNMLGEIVIFNLGANGDCSEACKIKIIENCEDREVFWLTVTNDDSVHVNDKLLNLASKYDNLHIIDWNSISKGHTEYFVADGIHLTESGRKAYTTAIYDSIYELYLEKYNNKKDEIINEHDEQIKSKISFYGNDILLNAFDYLQTDFGDSKFVINKDFNYETLKEEIEKSIQDNTLTYKIVFAFDNTTNLSLAEYEELIKLCLDHEIYIISTNKSINDLYNLFSSSLFLLIHINE